MKFGDYLRQAREKAGWTQPEAAAKIGIEQSYLSKMETGKSYPSEEVFDELARAYNIDVSAMTDSVSTAELDRLREISAVRAMVLQHQQTATTYLRGWMVAGLILVIFGSGLLVSSSVRDDVYIKTYHYQSPGVIKPGESVLIFQQLAERSQSGSARCEAKRAKSQEDSQQNQIDCSAVEAIAEETLAVRTAYDNLTTTEFLGLNFVRDVGNGNRRRYELRDHTSVRHTSWLDFLHAIGIAMIVGGLASFFISSRWR